MQIRRRELTPDEMFELRRVAYHEAAHATCAAALCGLRGEIRLQPFADRRSGGFTFGGVFEPHEKRDLGDVDLNRLYGLAGVVAEAIDGGWETAVHILIGAQMSPPDAELARGFTEYHVAETIGLLKWHWPEVELRATKAMEPWLRGPMSLAEMPPAPLPELPSLDVAIPHHD